MKKLLAVALMLGVLTAVVSAQPYKPAVNSTFPQWVQRNQKILSYLDWKKATDKQAARNQAAAKKAYNSIPAKAKAQAKISWTNYYQNLRTNNTEVWTESYTCSVILMDYNEKNGLGTVNVAFKNDCFKDMQKNALQDWFTFRINLSKFDAPNQEESFEYEYNKNGDGAASKNLKAFKHIKIANTDYYQFAMPVRTPALKNGFKALFPTHKSFITAEKAALALKLLPKHSAISTYEQR